MKTLHIEIYGRVQGVFFRDSMRLEAQRLGITGWVRNRSDGAVEATVQGDPAAVNAIVRWSYQGPRHAKVEHVEIWPDEGSYDRFMVIG
ncbi:MAG: acylphosphatase [Gallionella sp.]|nr:acylphosphatase [Gallionella sp.]